MKLGHISLDGTKLRANASKHKAMSYVRMKQEERRLRAEIEGMVEHAEEVDRAEDEKYGVEASGEELPEELVRRESRLKKIREAMRALEQEAQGGLEEGRCDGAGSDSKRPVLPKDKAQRNFTDPESRIMLDGDKAFIQGYNAQAAVDVSSQVIVAAEVSNKAVDRKQIRPMVEEVVRVNGQAPCELSADAGFFSVENIEWLEAIGVEAYVSPDKQKHNERFEAPRGRIPKGLGAIERMRRKLRTKRGKQKYGQRKQTVEPVFGQIKGARGFRQFLLRGLQKVRGEWALICTAHNVLKLYRAAAITPPMGV